MAIFIGLWLIFSILAAYIAASKGRSGFGFFLLSVFLSPLVGIISALIISENKSKLEKEKLKTGEIRKCSYCAELIKSEATVCRYCGKNV